jgi:hypothetical protein
MYTYVIVSTIQKINQMIISHILCNAHVRISFDFYSQKNCIFAENCKDVNQKCGHYDCVSWIFWFS